MQIYFLLIPAEIVSTTQLPVPNKSDGSSIGIIIGIIVGVVAIAIVAAVMVAVFRKRKQRSKTESSMLQMHWIDITKTVVYDCYFMHIQFTN